VRPRARTPQGGVIRPLLANIYLAKLDRALGAKGEAFVRYADDLRLSIGNRWTHGRPGNGPRR
jgi:RNA-directed DNA polymerase